MMPTSRWYQHLNGNLGLVQRLSRAEQQLRNRDRVIRAARAEFTEHGYRYATIDGIAARADLTRGAVYSNFPGKRALYFATLATHTVAGDVAHGVAKDVRLGVAREPAGSVADQLSAYASAYLLQEHPGLDVAAELTEFDTQYVGLLNLNAVLLGLALDAIRPGELGRMMAIARQTHTLLAGAIQLAATPGFTQPLTVAQTCAHLAELDVPDSWVPPLSGPRLRPANDPYPDLDGVVLVLGLNRLAAAEDAVRTTAGPVTVALVTSEPEELAPIARYTTGLSANCLPQSRLRVLHDYDGVLASALGCDVIGDDLEYGVLLDDERIVARAEGFGAATTIAQAAISPMPSVSEPAARKAAPSHSSQIA
jgi:AcrR family transcriptional regulator